MTAPVFIGSLAGDGGITVARRGPDGGLTRAGHVPGEAPSFLAAHPALPVLYAVHGTGEGTVAAYDVEAGGGLRPRAAYPTHGVEPCHLAVAPDGSALAVANYDDGVVSVRALDPSGRPAAEATLLRHEGGGPHPERQRGPHAHMCHYTPDGLLYVVDLGADRVHRYLPDLSPHPAGPVPMPAGSGPRHIATDGRGHWYVAGELDATVTGWAEEGGRWRQVSTMPVTGRRAGTGTSAPEPNAPAGAEPGEVCHPSHVALSADGRLGYVAGRGPDTIAVFRADGGALTPVAEVGAGGRWPRHFALAGGYLYVANQNSGEVAVFALRDGIPAPAGAALPVPAPACVLTWERPPR